MVRLSLFCSSSGMQKSILLTVLFLTGLLACYIHIATGVHLQVGATMEEITDSLSKFLTGVRSGFMGNATNLPYYWNCVLDLQT
ncbi:hypothetical protein HMI54_011447 [Coelomomyces lativittatus]|nr:hypothetical protein HMI54_011447 [Coelomomyces lativittatus]